MKSSCSYKFKNISTYFYCLMYRFSCLFTLLTCFHLPLISLWLVYPSTALLWIAAWKINEAGLQSIWLRAAAAAAAAGVHCLSGNNGFARHSTHGLSIVVILMWWPYMYLERPFRLTDMFFGMNCFLSMDSYCSVWVLFFLCIIMAVTYSQAPL